MPRFHSKTHPIGRNLPLALLAAGLVGALLLATPPVASQTTVPTTAATSAASSKRAQNSMLSDLAEGNRAEVQAGQLALEKSKNPDIQKFAQMMIDDHGKALSEVETLAQRKGVKLPDGIGATHKAKELALKALSGKVFDSQYIKRAGVGDHESTVKLLKKIQAEGQDPDFKALADKMLPTVQHHLEVAKQLAAAK